MNEYEAQVSKFYSEIWDKKSFNEIPNVLHSDFVFRGSLGQEKRGHDGLKEYVDFMHSSLSDYRCIIEDIVVQHEKILASMTFTGLHGAEFMGCPPAHRQVFWVGGALFTVSGNKVASLRVLGDLKPWRSNLAKIHNKYMKCIPRGRGPSNIYCGKMAADNSKRTKRLAKKTMRYCWFQVN